MTYLQCRKFEFLFNLLMYLSIYLGDWGCLKRIENEINVVYFLMSKFPGYREKYIMYKVIGLKCLYRPGWCMYIHNYLFSDWKWKLVFFVFFSALQNFNFPSELWISIYNKKHCHTRGIYENDIFGISLYFSHFLLEGVASFSWFLICFKNNKHILDEKINVMITQ